jgi:hypothetical protein
MVFLLFGPFLSCFNSYGDRDGEDDPVIDPFATLCQNLDPGEVKCDSTGDNCCFRRCWGNKDIIRVTRNPDFIIDTAPECKDPVFPEWYYSNDCFLLANRSYHFIVSNGRVAALLWVQCFCGRTATAYSGESSEETTYYFNGCDEPLERDTYHVPPEFTVSCDDECSVCQPRCNGRECGPDGCGGSCGTCVTGTCNAAGQCESEQDTCSACLSSCRGLPSCCTGCGCLCEYECGMCW